MVETFLLIMGLGITIVSIWAMLNPHKDFAIGKRIDPQFWGVDNKEELELSEIGVLKNRIAYGIAALTGLFLIIYAL